MKFISWETYKERNSINGFDLDEYDKWINKYFEPYSDKELGINEKDYLDKDGHYKDYSGYEYNKDQDYLTLQKFYLNDMKPTKDCYHFLSNHYNTYSYVKKNMIILLLNPRQSGICC